MSDEDASYETFSLAGMHFANNHFEGNGVAIHVDLSTDANAFCSARGWYSEEVHSFIRDGDPGYQPNPEYTSYIEFDLQRLHGAIAYMAFGMWGRNQGVLCKPVQYGAREKLLTKQQSLSGVTEQMTQEQLIEICFTKPDHFVGEQEFRFLILHEGEVSRVDTTDLDARTKGQFTGAILSVNVIE